MKILHRTLTSLGGILLAALLITALAPKAARGVAAALVQVTNTASSAVPTEVGPGNFPFVAAGDARRRLRIQVAGMVRADSPFRPRLPPERPSSDW